MLWIRVNCLEATQNLYREAVYSLPLSLQKFLVLIFNRPLKDERLSRTWSHQVVLNTEPLDWEFSALTTRSLPPRDAHAHMYVSSIFLLFFLTQRSGGIHRWYKFSLRSYLPHLLKQIFPWGICIWKSWERFQYHQLQGTENDCSIRNNPKTLGRTYNTYPTYVCVSGGKNDRFSENLVGFVFLPLLPASNSKAKYLINWFKSSCSLKMQKNTGKISLVESF